MTARATPSGGAWVCTPAGYMTLLGAWAIGHLVLRVWLSPVLTIDDAREAVLAQTLAWGYQPRQPPLYNWLVWATFRLVGPSVLALTALKYALLVVAHGLVYATARRVLASPCLAAAAGFSFLLVVPISWTFHEALTHSVAVYAACAATAYALVRLEASGSAGAYALLGVALGAGALSKYTYALFAAALLGAALTLPPFRRRLVAPRIVITGAVAAALLAPFAIWFVTQGHDLWQLYAREVRADRAPSLRGIVHGLGYVLRMLVYYLGVPALALAWLAPGVYRPDRGPVESPASGRLLGRYLAAVLVVLAGAALAGVLAFLKYRWLIPAFFLAPTYALWRAERQGLAPGRLAAYARLLVVAEVAVTVAILVAVLGTGWVGRPYVLNEPYDVVAEAIGQAGFTHGTLVVGPGPLAGSLRLRFPQARVLSVEHPYYAPPPTGRGRCVITWEERSADDARRMPEGLQHLAESALGVEIPATPAQLLEAPYRFGGGHLRRVRYLTLPGETDGC